MRGREAGPIIASRLEADLRVRFPDVTVRWAPDEDEPSWRVFYVSEPNNSWGPTSIWADDDDELDDDEVEKLLVDVAENVADNLWPDEATDPWPVCPEHGDHPLAIGVIRGRACWHCRRDGSIAIPIGTLAELVR